MSELTNSIIAQTLRAKWTETYGSDSAKQNNTNIYLYWFPKKDPENHAHFFINDDDDGFQYNIKCDNNDGNERTTHKVTESSIEELIQSVISNWENECPDYTSQGGGRILYKRTKKRKTKKRKTKKRKTKKRKTKRRKKNKKSKRNTYR